jgi:hypothetical protein
VYDSFGVLRRPKKQDRGYDERQQYPQQVNQVQSKTDGLDKMLFMGGKSLKNVTVVS